MNELLVSLSPIAFRNKQSMSVLALRSTDEFSCQHKEIVTLEFPSCSISVKTFLLRLKSHLVIYVFRRPCCD
jgi:hypothetical protein